jgi:hypothetical protein
LPEDEPQQLVAATVLIMSSGQEKCQHPKIPTLSPIGANPDRAADQ